MHRQSGLRFFFLLGGGGGGLVNSVLNFPNRLVDLFGGGRDLDCKQSLFFFRFSDGGACAFCSTGQEK